MVRQRTSDLYTIEKNDLYAQENLGSYLVADSNADIMLPLGHENLDVGQLGVVGQVLLHHSPH